MKVPDVNAEILHRERPLQHLPINRSVSNKLTQSKSTQVLHTVSSHQILLSLIRNGNIIVGKV